MNAAHERIKTGKRQEMRKRDAMIFVKLIASFIVYFILETSAIPDWRVQSSLNRMTDKHDIWAELEAKEPRGVMLKITCLNKKIHPDISFPYLLAFGKIGVNYRFDADPVVPRITQMSTDGRSLWLWIGQGEAMVQHIVKAKRLRMEVFPPLRSGTIFLDFDLTGASDAIRKIKCI